MLHGRQDWSGAGPFDDVGPEEPVFVVLGRDRAAPGALRHYANLAQSLGASWDLVDSVRKHADAMEAFQAAHGSKVPDLKG